MSNATPATSLEALVAHDGFSSEYLGRAVYRLRHIEAAREAVQALSAAPRPLMIEAKVPSDGVATLASLTAAGFQVIDTGVQLDRRNRVACLDTLPPRGAWRVREAVAGDRAAVERVSGDNLTTSRFHLDPQIDRQAATRLKRAWAGNFFEGRRGQRLLVVDGEAGVGGFLLTLEKGPEGVIDLVALDPALRGTGALAGLIDAWVAAAPALEHLRVGTQISNVSSLRAYGRLGFRIYGTAYVLHYHA